MSSEEEEEEEQGDEPARPKRKRRRSLPPPPKKGTPPIVTIGSVLGLLVATTCLSGVLKGAPPEWKDFKGQGYTISMPGTPEPKSQSIDTANGPTTATMYAAKAPTLHRVYGVMGLDLPNLEKADPDKVLDAMLSVAGKSFKGNAGTARPIALGSAHGREVEITDAGEVKQRIVLRVYLAKTFLLQAFVGVTDSGGSIPEDEKFFSSLRIDGS